MIRQHFFPKAYFRHRSLSKGHSQRDSLLNQNSEPRCPRQIQCNQIKFKRKKSFVHDKNSRVYLNEETVTHSDYDKAQHNIKPSTSKIQVFIQEQAHTQICSQMHTSVLKQIHNRAFKEISTEQRVKLSQKQNDFKNLFVKSDRKQIIKANRNSYRVLGHSHSDNESFLIEEEWIKSQNKKRNSSRKLASADASHRCYHKSIERKKKKDQTPAEIIINASLSTVDVPSHKLIAQSSQRTKQPPVFEKMTQNLINLNLSKAIKYRQSSMQDKIRRQRKNSQKISLENIENRNNELEQKVRGWEILIDDDVEFS